MPRRRYSLTTRLVLSIAAVFAIGGGAVSYAAFAYGQRAAQASFDQLLIGAARQISRSVTPSNGILVTDLPVSAFELLSLAPEDRIVYGVFDSDRGFVTGYPDVVPSEGDTTFETREIEGEPFRIAQVVRPFAERDYGGSAVVLVGQTLRARQKMAAEITRNAMIAAGSFGILLSVLAALAVRAAFAPLRKIERQIQGRSAKDLNPLDLDVPREVESLVAALDRFILRLRRQIDVMQGFIADASHQIRTPIAALRAQADLAAEETDPAALRRIAERISTRSVNLSRLTDQLLTHALIIHRADAFDLAALDLRQVAVQVAEEFDHDQLADASHLELDLPEDAVPCQGDMLSLVEACKNLVANALRHGEPPITLRVGMEGGRPFIAVRDLGDGIPEADWAGAAKRYSRSSGVSPESAGLGLAIVASVARAHRGRLLFARPDGGGFEVRMEFQGGA
ncbi:sensor histidine kinase [Tropicimonas sediminicola]|uniref:histidine kinase n=1 Tax=Tropicimonas sediminicola TaxID=1031541 RepID=A0A239D0M2_9RHOB|nr:sensor histidine kinase [Tropicimonas sediminicola]SNS25769.1 two-component system, OmpR family, sensor histidine kinase TctE [Tropicimonas sediminicola]